MKNYLIKLLLVTSLFNCKYAKTSSFVQRSQFNDAVKSIFNNHVSNGSMSPKGRKHFCEIIRQVEANSKLDVFEVNELYTIESFNIEDGRTRGTIILNGTQINYVYFNKKIEYEQEPYFPRSIIESLLKKNISCDTKGEIEIYKYEDIYLGYSLKTGNKYLADSGFCTLD